MNKKNIKTQIVVKDYKINVLNGNIRDYTDLLHLVILNNLENINAGLIEMNIPQSGRLVKLNKSAKRQLELLKNNNKIKELGLMQEVVSKELLEIENK